MVDHDLLYSSSRKRVKSKYVIHKFVANILAFNFLRNLPGVESLIVRNFVCGLFVVILVNFYDDRKYVTKRLATTEFP